LKKSGIQIPPECESLPFPEEVTYIWEWFNVLRFSTSDDLSPVNIKAFFELQKIDLLPEEFYALQSLQAVLTKAQNEILK